MGDAGRVSNFYMMGWVWVMGVVPRMGSAFARPTARQASCDSWTYGVEEQIVLVLVVVLVLDGMTFGCAQR
jgi:hypothetical protein